MTKETVTMYRSDNGNLYQTEQLALSADKDYEKMAKYTTFWLVEHSPDLIQGGGYGGRTFIKAFCDDYAIDTLSWMNDYCFKNFGDKIQYIQNAYPIVGWSFVQITQKDWENPIDVPGLPRQNTNKLSITFGGMAK